MKIAILGYGREGRSVHRFLRESVKYKTAQISIRDVKKDPNYLADLKEFDIIFRSPGIPYKTKEVQAAKRAGIKISSSTKLFFEEFKGTVIGITGSKGKGGVATTLVKILKKSNRNAVLAGNIGKPMLDILPETDEDTIAVLELSSFQLQDLNKSPAVAVVLDVFPEHLDHHKTLKEYVDAKANIVTRQKKGEVVFYFRDNKLSEKIAATSKAKKIPLLGEPFGLKKNVGMAAAVALYLQCDPKVVFKIAQKHAGRKHRMEIVKKTKKALYVNDSASTNPHTAAMAVTHASRWGVPIFLIAGGSYKGLDYKPLSKAIKESDHVELVVLAGENKKKIKTAISKNSKTLFAPDLKEAVVVARKKIKDFSVILFSPGSASFDRYKNYEDRGEEFKKIVKKLKS